MNGFSAIFRSLVWFAMRYEIGGSGPLVEREMRQAESLQSGGHFMKKLILAVSALAFAGSAAFADPIAERQAIMKANGKAVGVIAPMVKGEKPFDAAAALDALETLSEDAQKIDVEALFPKGTETGGKTEASPKIWEDMAGFQAKVDKFRTDAAAAVAAAPADLEALKVEFGKVAANCGGCHETFRIKKS